MATVPEIKVKLGFDGRGFQAGLQRSQMSLDKWGGSVARKMAGYFSIGMVTNYLRNLVLWADNLSDMAAAANITGEQMQVLNIAMKKVGLSAEAVLPIFRALAAAREKALSQGPGGEERTIFERLGFDQKSLSGAKDMYELTKALAVRLKEIPAGAGRITMLSSLFGRGGLRVPLDDLARTEKVLRDWQLILSDEQLNRVGKAADIWDAFSEALKAVAAINLSNATKDITQLTELMDQIPGVPDRLKGALGATIGESVSRGMLAIPSVAFARYHLALLNLFKALKGGGPENVAGGTTGGPFMAMAGMGMGLAVTNIADEIARMMPDVALKAAKDQTFTPASDALARIGGFTGRGSFAAIEKAQEKTASNTTQMVSMLKPLLTAIRIWGW